MHRRGASWIACCVVVVVVTATYDLEIGDSVAAVKFAYSLHSPILIDGNRGFNATNGVVGGSGTLRSPYVIEGWEIDAAASPGIWVQNTTSAFVIRDVYVHSASQSNIGILLLDSSNGWVDRAELVGSSFGLRAIESARINVSQSTFSNNTEGIFLDTATWSLVYANDFLGNWEGLHIFMSSNISLTGNVLSNNLGGIEVETESTGIVIADNSIRNSLVGVSVAYSNNATVIENNFTQDRVGLFLDSSTRVAVYHNNFMNKSNQAYDSGGQFNTWDNGYPSGGNYWGNYSGVDRCSGPNQSTCNGPDGIGDTPYPVWVGDADRYPLMRPYPSQGAIPSTPIGLALAAIAGAIVLAAVAGVLVLRRRKKGRPGP